MKVTGNKFLQWLEGAGVVPSNTRRVVIDAAVGQVVMIYVEQYGTTEMLSVDPPPEVLGAQVCILKKESQE